MFDTCPWCVRREAGTGLKICGYHEYEVMACQWLQQLFVNWNTVSLWRDLLIHSKNSRCTSLGIPLLFPHYAQIHGSVHNMMPDENILKKKIIHSVVLNSVTWHLIRLLEVRVMNWRKTWWDITSCSKVGYCVRNVHQSVS